VESFVNVWVTLVSVGVAQLPSCLKNPSPLVVIAGPLTILLLVSSNFAKQPALPEPVTKVPVEEGRLITALPVVQVGISRVYPDLLNSQRLPA